MRRVWPYLVVLLSVMLDLAVVPVLTRHWIVPLLSFCTVIALGLLYGRTRGLLFGLIAGLLVDVLVGYPLGIMTAVYALSGYVSGVAGRKFQRYVMTVFVTPVLCVTLMELVMGVYAYIASPHYSLLLFGQALARIALQTALCLLLYVTDRRLLKPPRPSPYSSI